MTWGDLRKMENRMANERSVMEIPNAHLVDLRGAQPESPPLRSEF